MIKTLELTNVGPSDYLKIDFAERLNVFTGDNGLGKSFVLDVAWWLLTKNWSGEVAMPEPQELNFDDSSKKLPSRINGCFNGRRRELSLKYKFQDLGQVWKLDDAYLNADLLNEEQVEFAEGYGASSGSVVIYAKYNGDVSIYDPAKAVGYIALQELASFPEEVGRAFVPVRNYTVKELWDGVKVGDAQELNGLISDWGDWYREKDRHFDLLTAGVKHLSPSKEPMGLGELRRVKAKDSRKFPTIKTSYNKSIPVIHASAGIRKILSLLYALIVAWTEHEEVCAQYRLTSSKSVVLLIDEVDAHLHPQWQRSIIKSLESVMNEILGQDEIQTQLICTTHSPLLLASIEPIFDEEKDVLYTFDFDERDERVQLNKAEWMRHGSSSAWLTSPAFGLGSDSSEEREKAVAKAKLAVRNEVSEDEAKKIHELLVNSLRPSDPFWSFWRSRAEMLGWNL